MGKKLFLIDSFVGGISEATKTSLKGGYLYGDSLDFKSDLNALSIGLKATKDSGSTVTDLPKFIEKDPVTGNVFAYGDSGNFYIKSGGIWATTTNPTTAHGQGMKVWNDYVYLRKDSAIARYGPLYLQSSEDGSWLE